MKAIKKTTLLLATLLLGAAWGEEEPTVGVNNVVARQRYPWNGLVDIECDVTCSDTQTNLNLYVMVRDNTAGKSLAARHVWLESDATHTNALEVKAGHHRLVWDAGTDNPNVVSTNVIVDVQALVGDAPYLVIDLSGGTESTTYPVTYLGAPPTGGWTDEYKTTKLVLRRIQPGTFMMGSPSDEAGRSSDEVQHSVTITQPFYLGVFQVTQKQYALVTGNTPSYDKGDMRPVEYVSWNTIRGNSYTYNWPNNRTVDPSTFIGKMRTKAGLDGFDLPTEAQWEYACRAGTTTALNSGKNLTNTSQDANMAEVGRYGYNNGYEGGIVDGKGGYSSYHTTVGSYQPNAWGLYDMHGNVFEWCLDWYASYSGNTEDPYGPASGPSRVKRGGSWCSLARHCRSATRGSGIPSSNDSYNGFRLCCSSAGL